MDGQKYVTDLRCVLGVSSDEELSRVIGVSTSTIRTWKYKNTVPQGKSLRAIEDAIKNRDAIKARENGIIPTPLSADLLHVYRELDFDGKAFTHALHKVFKTGTDEQLAAFIGCSASVIRWWKYRNQRPGNDMVKMIKDALYELEMLKSESAGV